MTDLLYMLGLEVTSLAGDAGLENRGVGFFIFDDWEITQPELNEDDRHGGYKPHAESQQASWGEYA